MTGVLDSRYTINGLVGTDAKVMDNLQKLAAAAGSWLTYDVHEGKWAVIINMAGTTLSDGTYSFDDSNIIGAITISSTGVDALYNSVKVSYPHEDLRSQTDFIQIAIPSEDRYPNEPDNCLNLNYGLITNPVQAQLLAFIELNQSRVDKVVKFTTDYSKIYVKAGDLIDITNSVYGFTNKLFRVLTVSESDLDTGEIVINITALEYDAAVYDESTLARYTRTDNSQIGTANLLTGQAVTNTAINSNVAVVNNTIASTNAELAAQVPGASVGIDTTFIILSWQSYDGADLDIRCRIITPDVGQAALTDVIGYTTASKSYWPTSGTKFMQWGGDNQGTRSVEEVAIWVPGVKAAYPSATQIVVECRGNWYTTLGTQPVYLSAALYTGGTITGGTIDGGDGSAYNYHFTMHSQTASRSASGFQVKVTSAYNDGTHWGDIMGYFKYDIVNKTAKFDLAP